VTPGSRRVALLASLLAWLLVFAGTPARAQGDAARVAALAASRSLALPFTHK